MLTRKMKISYSANTKNSRGIFNFLPMLKLSGKWFKEAGFDINDNVEVVINNGIITIKKAS